MKRRPLLTKNTRSAEELETIIRDEALRQRLDQVLAQLADIKRLLKLGLAEHRQRSGQSSR